MLLLTLSNEVSSPAPPLIGPYLNGLFTETAPGDVGSWEAIDAYPNIEIPSPLRMISFPGTEDYLILSKLGIIYRVNFESQSQEIVLDIRDRSFKLGEAGTVGVVLHPKFGNDAFPDKQNVFVFYRHKPEPDKWSEKGFNRLSKFPWNNQTKSFDHNNEEILIQQYDRSSWHNGGGMFFGPDEYLYLALGDEGFEEHQKTSTQNLELSLFSGIIRIDVDNDHSRSHPILRQPQSIWESEWNKEGWQDNFSQGYSIPNDNPWLSPDGSALEEFYLLGVRNPYSTFYDEMEDQIWLLDVGSVKREEINKANKGDNLQWPYIEGDLKSEIHSKPTNLIGKEKTPLFHYDRSVGSCIIGGGIYRSEKFPSLFGKFLLADYIANKVMALSAVEGIVPEMQTLIPDLEGLGLNLPEKPGISGIHVLENGEVLITVIGDDHTDAGKIISLKQNVILPDPPTLLSELNIFENLESLKPIEGIIPYSVNAPLWSDRALKQRWIAIPDNQKIEFKHNESWTFPEGTVFIKHFELPITTDKNGPTARLETRFFIIGKNNAGYGLTYKWNDEGTDAELLRIGAKKTFDITEGGVVAYQQIWDYPSRDQCLSCHNSNAGYVLGVNTHQLNGDQYYFDLGMDMNQLQYLSDAERLNTEISDPNQYRKSYNLADESADLELRIRSYLDSNCASCHRLGGIPMVGMDLRSNIPLKLTNIIGGPTQSLASDPNRMIVKPGDHLASELWIRDASEEENMMPPLARNLVDEEYVRALAEWIDGLPEDAGANTEFIQFPNPSKGDFYLRFSDTWESPIQVTIYSIAGKILYTNSYDTTIVYMEFSHYPAGTYLMEAQSREDKIIEKFVIQ